MDRAPQTRVEVLSLKEARKSLAAISIAEGQGKLVYLASVSRILSEPILFGTGPLDVPAVAIKLELYMFTCSPS